MYKKTINKHYDWEQARHMAGPWTQALRDLMAPPGATACPYSWDEARDLVKTKMTSKEVYELIVYILQNPSYITQHMIYSYYFDCTITAKRAIRNVALHAEDDLIQSYDLHQKLEEDWEEEWCYEVDKEQIRRSEDKLALHRDKMYYQNRSAAHIANLKSLYDQWEDGVAWEDVKLPHPIVPYDEDDYTLNCDLVTTSLLKTLQGDRYGL